MAPSNGPRAARRRISQKQRHSALVAPPLTTPKRRGGSSLDPEAPEFVSPAAVSTHSELASLICYRIPTKALNILIGGPSRDQIRSLIAAKEAERKKTLEWFTSVKQQLDGARRNWARVAKRALGSERDEIGMQLYVTNQGPMEQEIIELEISWDSIGRVFVALGEEIEGLWGELAVARR